MAIQFDTPDEHEVFHAKESWIPVVLGAVPILLVGLVALLVAWRFFDNLTPGLILLGVSALVALASRIPRIIANLDTDIVITEKRLYARTGIVNIKDQVCDLSNVSDITVDPTVFGRVFDYADVRIQTYAGEQDFEMRSIAHAYELRKAISRGADSARNAPAAAQPPRQRHDGR